MKLLDFDFHVLLATLESGDMRNSTAITPYLPTYLVMVGNSQQLADFPQDHINGVNIIFDGKSQPFRFETLESFLLWGHNKKAH